VVCALAITWDIAPGNSASGATPNSILCGGYTACSQGLFSTHGYPSHAGTSYWQMYAGDNCTNYVAYTESTFGVVTPSYDLGNADQWVAATTAHGVTVNHTPTVGAIAVWSADMGYSGHVAVVEALGPNDSYIVISQQHMIVADGYDWVRIYPDASKNQWQDWPNAFIHFPLGPAAQSRDHDWSRLTARFRDQ
jgi:surface antigen